MMLMIYYNFVCGMFWNILEMMCQLGEDLVVIEYLQVLFMCEKLVELFVVMGMFFCEFLCQKGIFYVELGLDNFVFINE